MLIGVKHRFVFVANSKTASTSIEQALANHAEILRGGSPQRKHITLRDALVEYAFLFEREGFEPETFFRFGVIRDPKDWIGSWFRYRRGNKVASPLPKGMDFPAFWARNDWTRHWPDGRPRLQRDFFTDAAGAPIVDYLIPYDRLAEGFAEVTAHLGLTVALGKANVSTEKAESLDIPAKIEAEIRAHYAQDYALIDRMDEINAKGLARMAARKAA